MEKDRDIEQQEKEDSEVRQTAPSVNRMGLAGFILVILGIVLDFMLLYGSIFWILGFIFSCIGVIKRPRGFAIAGIVITLLYIVLLAIAFYMFIMIYAEFLEKWPFPLPFPFIIFID